MTEDPTVAQCRARVGQLISGKWRLDALIGIGGMAAVYMATHRNGSVGAIKLLHDDIARNEEVRERFLREAYIANKVGHPGTVKVLDDDVDEHDTPYLVMELLQGESVEAKAERSGGRLTVKETLDIVDQTLAVLESAHKQAIVHRDLKPENLFVTRGSQLKVLDFGIARLREDNARKTQTGMVMGTPSFMAPEQAMGRWNDVDARTDIYAVGATAFTLLTGLPVHEAETAGEMLVAAATRPARSLARVLNNAPFNLVALVDRALSYERTHRFPDATSFRAELAKVAASIDEQDAAHVEVVAKAPVMPATVQGEAAPDGYERLERNERLETFDPSSNSPEEIERMQTVFELLDRGLVARKQYGPKHPESKRRMDECFKELASALMTCDICLAWNLTPYAFLVGDNLIWEPQPPWNRVPYQLFADGVRTMGFVPGLDEKEFSEWLDVITLDPTTDLAPEDDMVTRLWDEGFENVFHQAIDAFAEGSQEQRARFEADRIAVINGAHVDHAQAANDAWKKTRGESAATRNNAGTKTKQVIDYINRNSPVDAEAAARVANLNLQEQTPDEAQAAQSVMIDDATKTLLAARLVGDVAATSDRFVVAAAEAFIASAKMGRSQTVTAPLRRAVDQLSAGEPEKAMDMILQLRERVALEGKEQETESLRATITAEVLSQKTLLDILKSSRDLPDERSQSYGKGLTKILECIQGQHFDAAISFLPQLPPGKIRQLLLDFMRRVGRGYEPKIGALFASADVELGLDLVRLLVTIESDAARDAVSQASNSPHPLVRIEALGHLEGVSGTRVRNEMRKLLDDVQLEVRLAALKAMAKHEISAAGPFLVLRIQDPAFLKLPYEEREQSLETLRTLRPKRCEEVCIALLKERKLFRSKALETTRELATHFLAEVTSTDAGFHTLTAVARSRPWHNGKTVRGAAKSALERIEQRAKQALEAQQPTSGEHKKPEGRTTMSKRKRKSVSGSKSGATKGPQKPKQPSTGAAAPAAPAAAEQEDPKSALRPKPGAEGAEPQNAPGARRVTTAGGG